MKKRVLSLAAAIVLLLCFCLPVFAEFDPATRNSVVVVYTGLDTNVGEIGFGWGSGFFVGETGENPTYLITNHHVIADFLDSGQGDLFQLNIDGTAVTGRAKIRVYYDSGDYEEAYVVAYDHLKDVAVLKLGAPTSKRTPLPLEIPTDSVIGSPVYAVGYPSLAENVFADSTTHWGSSDSTVTTGTVSRLFLTAGTGVSSIQLDCDIRSGNSGGPLLNDRNAVIGINTYGVDTMNYAVNISEAITLLRQHGIPFSESGGDTEHPQNAERNAFPLWGITAAVAVGMTAIVLIVVLIVRNKKKAVSASEPQTPPVQPSPVRTGYARSLSQQHRGSRIQLGPQPVLLGRERDCALIYQENTPGVSGRHCSLSWDAASGDFILTDLRSTYGTYLINDQKLTPNLAYRLRSGDQFYLGDKVNLVQLNVE